MPIVVVIGADRKLGIWIIGHLKNAVIDIPKCLLDRIVSRKVLQLLRLSSD